MAEVVEHLVPETRIQKVQHRVLDTADVEVHSTRVVRSVFGRPRAHPVGLIADIAELFAVVRVGVAQLVPRTARPLRHDIGVASVGPQTIAEVEVNVHPVIGFVQWRRRFAVGVVGVE